ncbi:beta-1,4-galactosyltransferase galt-1-like [Limulus polyphemus]|uniref:Glycosyltransferase family 92 protein n=1 Tax=Limulus polyphemus TaxID=6850 RepID=A0ABM1B964_LIMPO|nr:beta-1,4-galactosyltransferase galt-1-like [Limulus polyphemus]
MPSKQNLVFIRASQVFILIIVAFCVITTYYIQLRTSFSINNSKAKISVIHDEEGAVTIREEGFIEVNANTFVYSAYWDDRLGPNNSFVRVIGTAPRNSQDLISIVCLVYVKSSSNNGTEVRTTYITITDNHGRQNAGTFFLCHWPADQPPPKQVALRDSRTLQESTRLTVRVRNHINLTKIKDKLGLCVRPFFGYVKSLSELQEFIAVYYMLGVSQFTFYKYELDDRIEKMLYALQKKGISIELLPWNLPTRLFRTTWAGGQYVSIEDCIYRNMYDVNYVAVVDVDEFIFPRNHSTLQAMISSIANENWGSLIFRNAFFCTSKPSDQQTLNSTLPFRTMTYLQHQKNIWPAKKRSKVIVQPTKTIICGIHYVFEHFNNSKEIVISPSVAILHHYRHSVFCRGTLVTDKTALRFKIDLLKCAKRLFQ